MIHLAFESSCDDTSVALFKNEQLICMRTHTQAEHEKTSGVVPEIAARLHSDHIFWLITEIVDEANIRLEDIDAYCCTREPGLIPSLMVGMTVAKMLAQIYKKPLHWINHIEAHVFSVFLDRDQEDVCFPAIVLSASGWHNDLFLWKGVHDLKKIGGTRDDSAGESMDKVGRELWLPFPSGRYMDEQANLHKNPSSDRLFPIPLLEKDSLDFSFSGLKSAAIRDIREQASISNDYIQKICYEYRESICITLVTKLIRAIEKHNCQNVYLVWGVSANSRLRTNIQKALSEKNITPLTPKSLKYCWDNAAMVWITGYYKYLHKDLHRGSRC